ncbi:MAG TPA: response regulator [Lacunisphaera sp.]|nr:response regulator [Lacunisphaera sp.]
MSDAGATADLLLLEDNPQDLELALRALRRAGINNSIRVVRDGVEALAWILAEPAPMPKLILLDLKVPKVSGLDVLRRVKEDPRTRGIPVVVLTSSREQVDVSECYRLGANSYVVKPVEFDRFAAVVRQIGQYWLQVNQPQKVVE